jgi:hypothetical protein
MPDRSSLWGDVRGRRGHGVSLGLEGLALIGWVVACGGDDGEQRAAGALSPAAEGMTTPASGAGVIDANGELVIDELDDSDGLFSSGAISGEWFTYSDGTGAIMPPDHTGLDAIDGEAHVAGTGFSMWGAGLSAYFTSVDLTAFDGMKLRARGTGSIVIELATPATSPPGEGGTCMGTGCFGHFATSITLEETYRDYDIVFAALAQPSWAQPAELALDGVISLNLVAKVAGAAASLDLWVDRLALHAAP